jgi:hypothetical protein
MTPLTFCMLNNLTVERGPKSNCAGEGSVMGFLDLLRGTKAPKRPSWADDKNAQWAFSVAVLKTTRSHGIPDVFVGATLNHPDIRPSVDARFAEMEARGESRDAQASFAADNVMAGWRRMSDKERNDFLALKAREQGGKWGR